MTESLNPYGRLFVRTMQEQRPDLYGELLRAGTLHEVARQAGEAAAEEADSLLQAILQQDPGLQDFLGQAGHLAGVWQRVQEIVHEHLLAGIHRPTPEAPSC